MHNANNIPYTEYSRAARAVVVENKPSASGILLNQRKPNPLKVYARIINILSFLLIPFSEKFVTRAEYDDLETRFSHLEALFTRLSTTPTVPTPALSASSISLSKCELCMHTGLSSIATQTFKSAANHIHFNPSVIPPSNCMHLAELGRSARRHTQPDSRPPRCYPGPTTIQSTVLPAHLALPSSGRSPSDMTSPLEPYQQHSPLLPASIMSPYNFESQPKKDHALTLPLSERLLPGLSEGLLSPCEDPAMLLGSGRPRYKNKSVSASLARCITTHPGLVKDGAGNGTDTETDEHSASGSVCTYQR